MIEILNRLVDEIEQRLGDDLDVDDLAASMGTTGYHARRMFSSLGGHAGVRLRAAAAYDCRRG